jgi:hypothetical protein
LGVPLKTYFPDNRGRGRIEGRVGKRIGQNIVIWNDIKFGD